MKTAQVDVVYVSIGNSDDKLTQSSWGSFTSNVREICRRHAATIIGEWYSAPDSFYQNACFAFIPPDDDVAALMQLRLSEIAAQYKQESIAWARCPETEFLS